MLLIISSAILIIAFMFLLFIIYVVFLPACDNTDESDLKEGYNNYVTKTISNGHRTKSYEDWIKDNYK